MNIRKSMLVVVSVFFSALLLMPPVVHGFNQGDELLWACSAELDNIENAMRKIQCVGYLQGMLDGVQLVFGLTPESKFFCPPVSGMSADQQLRIVIKYLENNPETLHQSARVLVLSAYTQAFPCK